MLVKTIMKILSLSLSLSLSKFCKKVYQYLEKKASVPSKSQRKWIAEDIIADKLYVNWKNTYSLAFLCANETKLREFQFKLPHRHIATDDFV